MHRFPQLVTVAFALTALASPAEQPVGFRGSEKAPVTVMVFSDFESFPCSRAAEVLKGVVEDDRGVRLIFNHAPAGTNPKAMLAHEAALAAGAKGKFWEIVGGLRQRAAHDEPRGVCGLLDPRRYAGARHSDQQLQSAGDVECESGGAQAR